MADEIASLGIGIDTTSVPPAIASLDQLATSAAATEASTKKLSDTTSTYQSSLQQMAAKINETNASLRVSATEAAAYDAHMKSLNSNTGSFSNALSTSATALKAAAENQNLLNSRVATFKTLISQGFTLDKNLDIFQKAIGSKYLPQVSSLALGGIGPEAANEAEKAVERIEKAHARGIFSSMQIREAFRITKDAVAGNYDRMAGSAATFALYTNASMLGIIGGIALVLAPLALLAAAFVAGQNESAKFRNSMTVAGGYAGLTAGQFRQMALDISKANDVSISSTKAAIQTLVSTGKYSADTIKVMTDAAVRQGQLTGESTDKIVKSYADIKGHIIDFAIKHEEAYHDITLAQLKYIDQLDKSGEHEKAERTFFEDVDKTLRDRTIPAYGSLEKVLHAVTNAASTMWDKLLNIGRQATLEDQIGAIKDQINKLNTEPLGNFGHGGKESQASRNSQLQALEIRLQNALEVEKLNADSVAAQAKNAQNEDDAIHHWADTRNKHPRTATDKTEYTTAAVELEKLNDLNRENANFTGKVGDNLKAQEKTNEEIAKIEKMKESKGRLIEMTQAQKDQLFQLELTKIKTKEVADAENKAWESARGEAEKYKIELAGIQAAVAHGNITKTEGANLTTIADAGNVNSQIGKLQQLLKATQDLNTATQRTKQIELELNAQKSGSWVDAMKAGLHSLVDTGKTTAQQLTSTFGSFFDRLQKGFADSIGQAVFQSKNLGEALKSVARDALSQLLSSLIQMGERWLINMAMGRAASAANSAASIAEGAAVAAAWAPAMVATSVASFGAADAAAIAGMTAAAATGQALTLAGAVGLKEGGLVSGPGGPKGDKIPAWLSDGEFVVKAEATQKNRSLLEAINAGSPPSGNGHFANGGFVGGNNIVQAGVSQNHFHFEGANFGGADPVDMENRFRKVIHEEIEPRITRNAIQGSLIAVKKTASRQPLNGKR